jgi:succinate dehydrogenase hydrophobic anchor subunit
MKKRTGIIILIIHTILILLTFPYEHFSNSSTESWPFFFAFFIDFPISILFHKANGLLKIITDNNSVGFWWLTFSHFFLGAIWWLIIAAGIIKLGKLAAKLANK